MSSNPRSKTRAIWLIPIGMLLLALALTWPKIIHVGRNESGQPDVARGFVFGLAVALNLLAVLLLSPRRRNPES